MTMTIGPTGAATVNRSQENAVKGRPHRSVRVRSITFSWQLACGLLLCAAIMAAASSTSAQPPTRVAISSDYLFDDAHFHLTNYAQKGTDIHEFLKIMSDRAGRVTLFGKPLQVRARERAHINGGARP